MALVVKHFRNSENWVGFPERMGKPGGHDGDRTLGTSWSARTLKTGRGPASVHNEEGKYQPQASMNVPMCMQAYI